MPEIYTVGQKVVLRASVRRPSLTAGKVYTVQRFDDRDESVPILIHDDLGRLCWLGAAEFDRFVEPAKIAVGSFVTVEGVPRAFRDGRPYEVLAISTVQGVRLWSDHGYGFLWVQPDKCKPVQRAAKQPVVTRKVEVRVYRGDTQQGVFQTVNAALATIPSRRTGSYRVSEYTVTTTTTTEETAKDVCTVAVA